VTRPRIETDGDVASLHGNPESDRIVAEVKRRSDSRRELDEQGDPGR
jgi:alkylated DNA nucleotide flippase Atl1